MYGFEETLQNGQAKGLSVHDGQAQQSYFTESLETKHEPVSPEFSPVSEMTRCPSPGLEPVQSDDETLKEAAATPSYFGPPSEKEYFPPPPHHQHPAFASRELSAKDVEPRKRGILPWIIAVVVGVVIIGVALGVGLGVGLKKHGYVQHICG